MKISDLKTNKGIMCPSCRSMDFETEGTLAEGSLTCKNCNQSYVIKHETLSFIDKNLDNYKLKEEIEEFWKHLYYAAYKSHESYTHSEKFIELLKELEQLFLTRENLAVTEMPIHDLYNKKVLEIGSGAGAHSSLFTYKGANITALDLTLDRVQATSTKLKLISDFDDAYAIQGDAESLPFKADFFDIVYSNGVLHHTPDTTKAISEVYRVLKPGGMAVIMLYAKHSYLYWVNLFFLRGIIQGNIFKNKHWLGRVTEWMSEDQQEVFNPITRVFSHKELHKLFYKFDNLQIRKAGFHFNQFPYIGAVISRLAAHYTGYNNAGLLLYDKPWRNETRLELFLSRYIGFANNIKASK